jgi:hypothetical protein
MRPDEPRVEPLDGATAVPSPSRENDAVRDDSSRVAVGLGWPRRFERNTEPLPGPWLPGAQPARLGWVVAEPVPMDRVPRDGEGDSRCVDGCDPSASVPDGCDPSASVPDGCDPSASVPDGCDPSASVPVPTGTASEQPATPVIPEAPVRSDAGPVGAPLAEGAASRLGVIDGWWATLASAPLPDTLLGDGNLSADGLDLTNAHPSGLATLLAGRPTRLSSLFREPASHASARRRARAIRAGIQQLASERGVRAGFLALGMVSWWATDVGPLHRDEHGVVPIRAPLLLRGCELHPRGAGHEDYELDLDVGVSVNPEVLRRLREDQRIRLDGEALSGLAFGPGGFDPGPVFAHLEDVCAGVPGFVVDRRVVVGSFTAGSGALLGDLDAAAPAIRAHPLLGDLVCGTWPRPPHAGDAAPPSDPDPDRGDASSMPAVAPFPQRDGRPFVSVDGPPDPVLSVLPLDPAQRSVVTAARGGSSAAVHGPPGTGRTQALAATVLALVEAGQRILVVTPHRSSARALIDRIAATGLREVLLDLHDGCGDRAVLLALLGEDVEAADDGTALERTRRALDLAGDGDVAAVVAATETLTSSSTALHTVRKPWGVSAYDAMEALAALMATDVAPRTRVRLDPEVCRTLDTDTRDRLRKDLRDAASLGAFAMTRLDTRWLDAAVHSEEDVAAALTAAVTARDGLARTDELMTIVAEAAGLVPARATADWGPQLDLLRGVRDTLDVMRPAVYEQPIDDLIAATGGEGGPEGAGILARRSLRRRARALVRPGVHVKDLNAVLIAARGQRERWQGMSSGGGWPRVPTGLASAAAAVENVDSALATLAGYLVGTETPDLTTLPLDQVARRLRDLAEDGGALAAQPKRTILLKRLRDAGLGDLINDLRGRRCSVEDVDGELDLAWWTSVLETIIRGDPCLARHDPAQLAAALEELRTCGDGLAAAGVARVRVSLATRARAAVEAHPDQVRWLRAEAHRAHRSAWPGDLFRRAGDLIRALRPVLVMSPDAVARSLPAAVPGRPLFDTVVVDDASQVGMPETAAALARGRRFLVAGDPYGLPPASGRPSVLEALSGRLRVIRLDRDHRTRDGRLLTPLRHHYPEPWAVTPGAAASPPLVLNHVWGPQDLSVTSAGRPPETASGGTEAEIQRVVELVTEHAGRRPGESLLVVTLGARHADRVEEALRAEVGIRPELARWLEVHWTGRISEPFVVRPVHCLAGLERDAVIVSLGIPRTVSGRPAHRFGVLDGRFGRACLTAALSRARRRITMVSAFSAGDLDPGELRTDGARMLWEVLALAEDPVLRGDHVTVVDVDASGGGLSAGDPLVADLRDRLIAAGLPVRPGVEAPDWPLSLGVADPLVPGHLLLAVDVDGEEHAGCPSVVVRDQMRREAFERAGWTYVRVAAMDLFCDPASEVERVRRAWRAAGGRSQNETVTTDLVIINRPKVRSTWPGIPIGRPVGEYSADQLQQVAAWVLTDGLTRSVDELVAGVCESLQLVLRGPRVESLVTTAVRAVLGAGGQGRLTR